MNILRFLAASMLTLVTAAAIGVVLVLGRPVDPASTRPAEPPSTRSVAGIGAPAQRAMPTSIDPLLPDLAPPVPVEEVPGECLGHTRTIDGATETVDLLSRFSPMVFVGRITEVGPARWNTPDGRAPLAKIDINPGAVIRLARVETEEVLKGDVPAITTVAIPGGTIGCHTFGVVGFPEPREGARAIFFVSAKSPSIKVEGVSPVFKALPVDDGTVKTPADGVLTIAELRARVLAAKP